jgi:hypothetical protein
MLSRPASVKVNGFQGSAAAHGNKSRDRKTKKKKGGKKIERAVTLVML